jgi:hypothetical protein
VSESVIDANTTIFSPLTQVRRVAGAEFPPYVVNRLGLIDNEGPSAKLDSMPDKPAGMVRIILYGGSTAMGIGARDGTETISSQLERMLNAKAKRGTFFQVLNFGHGASQSYSDLQFMASMGVYLRPDVSISLNGFNDAFFATESSAASPQYGYIANWSDFSYHYNNAVNGLTPQRIRIPFLPFTSQLAEQLTQRSGRNQRAAKAFYEAMPSTLVTRWIDQSSGRRDVLLQQNLRFTAGYFVGRDSAFIAYLQPHPWQFRKLVSRAAAGPSEEELVNSTTERLTRLPAAEYKQRMNMMFDAYGERYAELRKEYGAYPNIRFVDLRHLFENFDVPAYMDIIHYTPAGQRRLAARMYEDLRALPIVRRNLAD